jgi:hypothetical protein
MENRVTVCLCGMENRVTVCLCGMENRVTVCLCGMENRVTVCLCGMENGVTVCLCGIEIRVNPFCGSHFQNEWRLATAAQNTARIISKKLLRLLYQLMQI